MFNRERERGCLIWCRRRDLNPHGLRHTPLKRACLPFHHFGTPQELEKHPQLRSRVAQTLNVLSSSLRACACCGLVAGLYEAPATRYAETDCHVVSCRASRTTRDSPREPHYRSGPKSLSIKGRSGRIGPLMLTGPSNVVHNHHSLTSALDDAVERRAQGSVAALFDVDNTLLPGEASEVLFFGFL